MALDWQTFKAALGHSSNTSVYYIDEEGSKIPIDSECKFQEAIRLAKLNKNTLRLILHGDKPKQSEVMCVNPCQTVQPELGNSAEKCGDSKMKNAVGCKESAHGDVPPEWFTHYMKKFKKELLHELKSHIHDTVNSAVEKKLSNTKSESSDLVGDRSEKPVPSTSNTHIKLKKKMSDLIDFIEQRPVRLSRKLYATKPERLEMLDQKTRNLLEDRRRLLESKHHFKSKLDKNCFCKNFFVKKSASFLKGDICLTLPRESEFTVPVHVKNDGLSQWRSPALVCYESEGVFLRRYRRPLPKLNPGEYCCTFLRGCLSRDRSPHYFKCRVMDVEVGNISPEFTCRINVVPVKFGSDPVKRSEEEVTQAVGTLIDFEKDLIAGSQKKIEENISEIEKSLQNIDLLEPSSSGKGEKGKKEGEDCQKNCDVMVDLGIRLMQETPKCILMNPLQMCNLENENEKGQNEMESTGSYEKIKKDGEVESSDSELSIIFTSEGEEDEEDNFFVVTSDSLNPTETAAEDKQPPIADPKEKPADEEPADKPEGKDIQTQGNKAEDTGQPSPTRCRCSPFGEEISKPKKMKSKSTEYRFTAANLTQPTFTPTGIFVGRPSRFTFTGEKEEVKRQTGNVEVPQTDALGRVIYAVNNGGWCLPVKEMLEREADPQPETSQGGQSSQKRQERRNERLSDSPPANNLPNALINGASNVASLAFNTAKSVINNLQSAFVTEGKTEMGRPAYEDKVKPSMAAMFSLYEMGYLDIQRNRMLLLLHNNDVNKVLDELVRLNENPLGGTEQE